MDIITLFESKKISNITTRYKSILAAIFVTGLMIDTMLSNISDLTHDILSSTEGKALFVVLMMMIYAPSYLLLIGYSREAVLKILSKTKDLFLLYKVMIIILHILIAFLIIISLQTILFSAYHMYLLVGITLLGYTATAIILGFMTYHMYHWYKRNKNNFMLLLFVLASAMTAAAALNLGLSQSGLILQSDVLMVSDNTQVVYPSLSAYPGQIFGDIYSMALIQTMLAYGLTWGAVSMLLYSYSKRIGIWKYLIIISLPMGAFIFGITPILLNLPTTNTYFDPSLVLFRILSISALLSVGVLFGMSFLTTVKTMRQQTKGKIVDYLFISAFGISALFISLAANIAFGAFPPFGIFTYGFTSIASFFFFIGIYSSAIKVSSDTELRRIIRNSMTEQLKFLDKIGSAQIEHQLETHALKLSKTHSEQIALAAGIQPEISADELRDYIHKAIAEMDKIKRK